MMKMNAIVNHLNYDTSMFQQTSSSSSFAWCGNEK